jgi:hypothetical protein
MRYKRRSQTFLNKAYAGFHQDQADADAGVAAAEAPAADHQDPEDEAWAADHQDPEDEAWAAARRALEGEEQAAEVGARATNRALGAKARAPTNR